MIDESTTRAFTSTGGFPSPPMMLRASDTPIAAAPALLDGAIAPDTEAATTVALIFDSGVLAASVTSPLLVRLLSVTWAFVLPPIVFFASAPPPLIATALPLLE